MIVKIKKIQKIPNVLVIFFNYRQLMVQINLLVALTKVFPYEHLIFSKTFK